MSSLAAVCKLCHNMQHIYTQSLPRGLARLWREKSCVLLQRLQHTVAESPVDPFVAQLQSKTEAELAELLNRHLREEVPQRDDDADDTVRHALLAGLHDAAGNAVTPTPTWPCVLPS